MELPPLLLRSSSCRDSATEGARGASASGGSNGGGGGGGEGSGSGGGGSGGHTVSAVEGVALVAELQRQLREQKRQQATQPGLDNLALGSGAARAAGIVSNQKRQQQQQRGKQQPHQLGVRGTRHSAMVTGGGGGARATLHATVASRTGHISLLEKCVALQVSDKDMRCESLLAAAAAAVAPVLPCDCDQPCYMQAWPGASIYGVFVLTPSYRTCEPQYLPGVQACPLFASLDDECLACIAEAAQECTLTKVCIRASRWRVSLLCVVARHVYHWLAE